MKLMGVGFELVFGRPTLALGSAFVHQTKRLQTTKTKRIKQKQKAKWAAGIKEQVVTMLESHTRQIDTIDNISNETSQKRTTKWTQNRSPALGRPAIKLLGGFNWIAVDRPSPLVLPWFLRHFVVWFAWKIPSSYKKYNYINIKEMYLKILFFRTT